MSMKKILNFNRQSKYLRSLLVIFSTLLVLTAVSATLFGFILVKDVTIIDGDRQVIEASTTRLYVEELLAEQGIGLNNGDRISVPLSARIRDNDTIVIERGKKIVLTADGAVRDIYSCEPVLSDALLENGIVLSEYDEITPALEASVTENMSVTICRVMVYEETLTEVLPRQEVIRSNPNKGADYSAVVAEGSDGSKNVTYRVVTRDGQEASREVVAETVLVAAVDRVVEKGTQGTRVVAASAEELQVQRVLECNATAYTTTEISEGVFSGKTASGRAPAYGVVAVDPSVIPLGTRLYIEALDGSWAYGYAVAGDTGGAIKGNKVDLFLTSHSDCINFGRRQVRVYVLE